MDFAKKFMEKYGWTEGDGLGKNKNGISKPLKANLKFDNTGLGHDKAAEFNNHWWHRVYNDAADNIDVITTNNEISMNVKNISLEISSREYSLEKLKKNQGKSDLSYNNFLKCSTLTNLGTEQEIENKNKFNDIKVNHIIPLTDDELFVACGGRTAHKGARHGLKLNGKLSRIEQQEKEFLDKINTTKSSLSDQWILVKNKKNKKIKEPSNIEENNYDKLEKQLFNNKCFVKSNKKKKKKKLLKSDLIEKLNSFQIVGDYEEKTETNITALNANSKIIKKKVKKSNKKIFECEKWDDYRSKITDLDAENFDNIPFDINDKNVTLEEDCEKNIKIKNKKKDTKNKISKGENKNSKKKTKKMLKNVLREFPESLKINKKSR